MNISRISLVLCIAASFIINFSVAEQDKIVRDPVPNFPIATSIIIPSETTIYYFSGVVPTKSKNGSFGDTKAQTINVLQTIENNLKNVNLTLADIVKMQVFLVGDSKLEGEMDFTGFMNGYKQFFGTEKQPNTPVRSAMQVVALVNPEFLVEIEVIAAKIEKNKVD